MVLKSGKLGYTDIRSMKEIVFGEQDRRQENGAMAGDERKPVKGKFYLVLD